MVLERVREGALLVADRARNQAHQRVGDNDRRKLTPRQHIIPDRYFLGNQMFPYPVVDPLVVAAEDYDIVQQRHAVGHRLVEPLPVGRRENHLVVIPLGLQSADAAVNRLYLHHHSRLTPERVVVDLAVLVGRIVAEVMDMELHQPLRLRPFQNRAVERRVKHLRQNRQYINSHLYLYCFVINCIGRMYKKYDSPIFCTRMGGRYQNSPDGRSLEVRLMGAI